MNIIADRQNLYDVFRREVQYRIPFYHRNYVWDQKNWHDLWNDIIEKSQLRLAGDSSEHFIGVIVVQPVEDEEFVLPSENEGLITYNIIDGQQRLATFQIILCVIRDICLLDNHTDITHFMDKDNLVLNTRVGEAHDTQGTRYKLILKPTDNDAFCSIIDGSAQATSSHHPIFQAYDYFKDQVLSYVAGDHEKMKQLISAIIYDFILLEIDLSKPSQKIFETSLPNNGQRMSEFDFLKNDLFLRAGSDSEKLYTKYWSHFDTDMFWDDETVVQFLRDFLIAKLGPGCIETDNLFNVYQNYYRRRLTADQGVEHEFAELKQQAEVYRERVERDA